MSVNASTMGGADAEGFRAMVALAQGEPHVSAPASSALASPPPEPASMEAVGLSDDELDALVLKVLLQHGNCSGSAVADIICLPRNLTADILNRLRDELLVTIKTAAAVNDFVFQLTDAGFHRAQRHALRCNYVGAASVPLHVYVDTVKRQSLQKVPWGLRQLCRAFSDLMLQPRLISQLGQALKEGRGMFLYGSPGNGKTSIAERISRVFGQNIWIPRVTSVGGELLRLYDASCHELAQNAIPAKAKYDRRWVLIKRPTIVVGGELTLEHFEPRFNKATGFSESPVQMKSNCGVLVIDDFGRQRVSSTEILNRLIVPMEKQFDFLHLASGRQVQIPFDQLLVLSTNLEPRNLVDEAFLRRIPYKIEVGDPCEAEFRRLTEQLATEMGFKFDDAAVNHLIEAHYRSSKRPFRFCHPRDLLRQIKNYCDVHDLPKELNNECFDMAVANYFAGLSL